MGVGARVGCDGSPHWGLSQSYTPFPRRHGASARPRRASASVQPALEAGCAHPVLGLRAREALELELLYEPSA
jgi:hypothetical protein